MILEELKTKLETLDSNVYYGLCIDEQAVWDYTVFYRDSMRANVNKTSYSDYYTIAVVRENYIDEDLELQYIDAIADLDGFRLGGDVSFSYVRKTNTKTVVEIMTIPIVRMKKRVV